MILRFCASPCLGGKLYPALSFHTHQEPRRRKQIVAKDTQLNMGLIQSRSKIWWFFIFGGEGSKIWCANPACCRRVYFALNYTFLTHKTYLLFLRLGICFKHLGKARNIYLMIKSMYLEEVYKALHSIHQCRKT